MSLTDLAALGLQNFCDVPDISRYWTRWLTATAASSSHVPVFCFNGLDSGRQEMRVN